MQIEYTIFKQRFVTVPLTGFQMHNTIKIHIFIVDDRYTEDSDKR